MDLIKEVRDRWAFYRDRRPDAYGRLVEALMSHARLITNGTVVSPTGRHRIDVLIDGETIAVLARARPAAGVAADPRSTPPASTSSPAASTCTPTWSCPSAAPIASDTFETGTSPRRGAA